MKRRLSAAFALAAALVAPAARADRIDEAWARGNDAYLRGDYDTAVAAYEELDRDDIVSPDLFFNLGDAYFKKNALGPAIWSFERAAALDPDDEDVRFNLDQARKLAARQARDKIEGEDHDALWIRAVTALSPSTETWVFLALYLAFFATLFVRRRADEDARPALAAGAAILAGVTLLAGAALAGRAVLERVPFGVVLPDAVAVKEGADVNYKTGFQIHAGLKVRLLERDQDWLRIRLANGLEGWVRAKEIGRL
ncbi:MAG TPA: SH3 domain-containing protein [Polyangia bacterium]|nr:SH3 domain-containing protein [Polyangia bacterium]